MDKLIIDKKLSLRREFRQRRAGLRPDERGVMDLAICKLLAELPEIAAASVVFSYLSRSGEVGTRSIIHQLHERGKKVLTPSPDIRALPHDGLFTVQPKPETEGHFPPVLCHETSIQQVDVVLVPGIAWDSDGYRVGFGGGYFDRLLAMTRPDCVAIGLAYACQLTERVPREPWDMRVNILVTEKRVYRLVY